MPYSPWYDMGIGKDTVDWTVARELDKEANLSLQLFVLQSICTWISLTNYSQQALITFQYQKNSSVHVSNCNSFV